LSLGGRREPGGFDVVVGGQPIFDRDRAVVEVLAHQLLEFAAVVDDQPGLPDRRRRAGLGERAP
jgi:hypothetical protein